MSCQTAGIHDVVTEAVRVHDRFTWVLPCQVLAHGSSICEIAVVARGIRCHGFEKCLGERWLDQAQQNGPYAVHEELAPSNPVQADEELHRHSEKNASAERSTGRVGQTCCRRIPACIWGPQAMPTLERERADCTAAWVLQLVAKSKLQHRTRIQDNMKLRCCQAIRRALLAIESDLLQILVASARKPRGSAGRTSKKRGYLSFGNIEWHCMTAGAADQWTP